MGLNSWRLRPRLAITDRWQKNIQNKWYDNQGYYVMKFSFDLVVLGFGTLLMALGIVSGYIIRNGPEAFTFIYHKWVGFLTAALLNAFVQAVYVYVASFRQGSILALGGNSGNIIYDASICYIFPDDPEADKKHPQWFIGRELNPSIGSFDIKTFNEMRPGLILWVLINVSMLCEQAVRRGGFANVTDSMWLVVAFQSFYVFDSLYNEVSFAKYVYCVADIPV